MILSTHVLEVLEKIADRYVLMRDGSVVADVSAERLKQDSASGDLEDYVLRLLRE